MKAVIFFNRLAALSNICFLIALLQQRINLLPNGNILSTILINGLLMAVIFNTLALVGWLYVAIVKKSIKFIWPLALFNLIISIMLFYYWFA
jgi:hypothetical protein